MGMCSLERENLEDIISRGENFKWAWRARLFHQEGGFGLNSNKLFLITIKSPFTNIAEKWQDLRGHWRFLRRGPVSTHLHGTGAFLPWVGSVTRPSVTSVPTLWFCGLLPSPGMQWSVVANGRVSATPQQLLLWWLLSPVTLRPRGQWLRRQPYLRERARPYVAACACGTDCTPYSLHWSVPSVRAGPRGSSSGIPAGGVCGSRGTGRSPCPPPEIPPWRDFPFPRTPSSWPLPHPVASPVCSPVVPGWSHSCSKHSRSLCPSSVIAVSK